MKKKIYIAGKVTGENPIDCTEKFGDAALKLDALGFEAINPLEVVGNWNTPWDVAMRKCITALMECDGIILLSDWYESKGARAEHLIANTFEIPVFNYTKVGIDYLIEHTWNK